MSEWQNGVSGAHHLLQSITVCCNGNIASDVIMILSQGQMLGGSTIRISWGRSSTSRASANAAAAAAAAPAAFGGLFQGAQGMLHKIVVDYLEFDP